MSESTELKDVVRQTYGQVAARVSAGQGTPMRNALGTYSESCHLAS
jgi:hypothetical protein